jgi:hypothetical protein
MPEILTESFCERCGTRYTFESANPRGPRLKGLKVMSRGLKNFVLSDDTSMDEAMAAARNETDRQQTAQQLDAFHKTFNFCMSCRQYTCGNCWNEADGRCLSCAPHLGHEILPAPFSNIGAGGAIALTDNEAIGLNDRNGHDQPAEAPAPAEPMAWPEPEPMAWPTSDLMPEQELAGEGPSSFLEAIDAAARLQAVSGPVEAAPIDDVTVEAVDEAPAAAQADVELPTTAPATDAASTDHAAVAAANTTDLLGRFRPGEDIDEQLAAYERAQAAAAGAAMAAAAEAAVAQAEAEEAAAARARADDVAAAQAQAQQAAEAAAEQARAEQAAAAAAAQVRAQEAAEAAATQARAEEAAAAQARAEEEAAAQMRAQEVAEAAAAHAKAQEAAAAAAFEARTREATEAAEAQAMAQQAAEAAAAQARADDEAAAAAAAAAAVAAAAAADGEARDDLVFQPTWQIVAPEAPTSDQVPASTPQSPTAPPDTIAATVEPQWPAQPEWPRPPSADGLPFLGRPAAASGGMEALWAESAREVATVGPAASPKIMGGVQPCVSCGLSLSANARFCRRCGTQQG